MKIEILGKGCPKCKALEANVRKAVEELKMTADILKVTDVEKIVEYDVMCTPALVVDGQVKSVGKIPKKEEILAWLGN